MLGSLSGELSKKDSICDSVVLNTTIQDMLFYCFLPIWEKCILLFQLGYIIFYNWDDLVPCDSVHQELCTVGVSNICGIELKSNIYTLRLFKNVIKVQAWAKKKKLTSEHKTEILSLKFPAFLCNVILIFYLLNYIFIHGMTLYHNRQNANSPSVSGW